MAVITPYAYVEERRIFESSSRGDEGQSSSFSSFFSLLPLSRRYRRTLAIRARKKTHVKVMDLKDPVVQGGQDPGFRGVQVHALHPLGSRPELFRDVEAKRHDGGRRADVVRGGRSTESTQGKEEGQGSQNLTRFHRHARHEREEEHLSQPLHNHITRKATT